jgi:hypothetical protein
MDKTKRYLIKDEKRFLMKDEETEVGTILFTGSGSEYGRARWRQIITQANT